MRNGTVMASRARSKKPPSAWEKLFGEGWERSVMLITMLATVHVVLLSIFFANPAGVAAAGDYWFVNFILLPLHLMHNIQNFLDLFLSMDDHYFLVVTISGLISIFVVYSVYILIVLSALLMKKTTSAVISK
jgi:hypothetical protein